MMRRIPVSLTGRLGKLEEQMERGRSGRLIIYRPDGKGVEIDADGERIVELAGAAVGDGDAPVTVYLPDNGRETAQSDRRH